MWVTFSSNHIERSRSGVLAIKIQRERVPPRLAVEQVVHFSIPPGYHVHNDSVAAAALTLVGTAAEVVTFNFPISAFCAETLRAYYDLAEVGPVDASLEPRRPGRSLGLNFSGGLDSSALRALLDRILPGEYRVISTAFEGADTHEHTAQAAWPPDLQCVTDFRRKGFFAGRYFNAVPLLFADYLDLYGLTSAHVFSQDATSLERNIDGHRPAFLNRAPTLAAGGLEEVHLFRGVDEVAVLRILMRLVPERLEAAVRGSSQPGTLRNISRRLSLRILYEQERLAQPPFVAETLLTTQPESPGGLFAGGIPILFVIKHYGQAGAAALSYGDIDMTRIDWSFLDALSMEFAAKYNTNFLHYAPAELRAPLLTLLANLDVGPFNERDWLELDACRQAMAPVLIGLGVLQEPL